MHFGTKSYLKSNRNHTAKHIRNPYTGLMYFKIINLYLNHPI
jgi:hypothetical protein